MWLGFLVYVLKRMFGWCGLELRGCEVIGGYYLFLVGLFGIILFFG